MVGDRPPSAQRGHLREKVLSFWEVLAQSIAGIAPTFTPAVIAGMIFGMAGNATWLTFVIATGIVLLVAYHINQFTRHSKSPGAMYTFVGRGLGPTAGVITGWSDIMAYTLLVPANLAGVALFLRVFLHDLFGIEVGRIAVCIMALVMSGVLWWVACKDIRLSARLMLLLEFFCIGVIAVLTLLFFIGPGTLVDPPQLTLQGAHLPGFGLGLVLAILSFVGFESAATLGHEAQAAHRTVPRAIFGSVLIAGPFFVITSYALVAALRSHTPPLNQIEAPLNQLAILSGAPVLGHLITLGAAVSLFAATLAHFTAGSRVLFAMSRHGLLHRSAGDAHPRNATPHIAITGICLFGLGVFLALLFSGAALLDIFTWLATVSTFGFIFSYLLVSIASPVYLRKRGLPARAPTFWAVIAVVLLLIPLVGSVYPVPDAPLCYLPYVFLALLAVGTLWFLYLRMKSPKLAQEIYHDLEKAL